MTFKQAQRALAAAVADAGSQKQVAKRIGCTKGHLSLVLRGKKSFGLKYAPVIAAEFGIPVTAWQTARRRRAA